MVAFGARGDRAVQVGLAEEAAVRRIREVVGVGELAGIDDRKTPAFAPGVGLDARGRLGRHCRRGRMDHLGGRAELAPGHDRERHAVDAAAHRDRDLADAPQHGRQLGPLVRVSAQLSSSPSSARASATRRRRVRAA